MIRLFSKFGESQILTPKLLFDLIRSKMSKMPKKKNVSSSSDSDSGPDDRTPAKKAKTESTSSGQKTKDGIVFMLDGKKRVTVREFKGKTYIDIREFYDGKDGEKLPGKKGISLQPELWRKLIGMADEINSAISEV